MGNLASRPSRNGRQAEPTSISNDPLQILPDNVADKVLEFVDDSSLLAGRLVCRRWCHEITTRNRLWKARCKLSTIHVDKDILPNTDAYYFHLYRNAKHALHKMHSGDGLRMDTTCDGCNCAVHKATDCLFSKKGKWPKLPSSDSSEFILTDCDDKHEIDNKLVACIKEGQLIVIDRVANKMMWSTGNHETSAICLYQASILAITFNGNFEIYSQSGECKQKRNTKGKLRGTVKLEAYPKSNFILAGFENGQVCLVDLGDEMQVFSLDLPLLDQRCGIEPIEELSFLTGVDQVLNDKHLAFVLATQFSTSLNVITKKGKKIHQKTLGYDFLISSAGMDKPDWAMYEIVYVSQGDIVSCRLTMESNQITTQELWKKALPQHIAPIHGSKGGILAAGRTFLLTYDKSTLKIFRLDDGTLVADFPGFIRNPKAMTSYTFRKTSLEEWSLNEVAHGIYSALKKHIQESRDKDEEVLFVINGPWMDGLAPTTAMYNLPLIVLYSRDNTHCRCLRWSPNLWEDELEGLE